MRRVTDEILEALPYMMRLYPQGPSAKEIADHCGLTVALAMKKAREIDKEGRALFLRYGGARTFHLVPRDHLRGRQTACGWCRLVFVRSANQRRREAFCSMRCAALRNRADPKKEARRVAGMRASYANRTRKRRDTSYLNDPGYRARQSERSLAMWADPAKKAVLCAALQPSRATAERKAASAQRLRDMWADPVMREKLIAGAKRPKPPHVMEAARAASRAKWADPEWRAGRGAEILAALHERNRSRTNTPEHQAALMAGLALSYAKRRERRLAEVDLRLADAMFEAGASIQKICQTVGMSRRDGDFRYRERRLAERNLQFSNEG